MSNGPKRIAVLGLYNSGSTALAGMLHRLGVNMGAPFWRDSDPESAENFYEPYDLSQQLRRCWCEPSLLERVPAEYRVALLRDWMALQESKCAGAIGAKHPLLCLCAKDLAEAWGSDGCLLWSCRSFDESLAGLQRRGWFPDEFVEPIQRRLWDALHAVESSPQLIKLDWNRVKANPEDAARRLALLAGVIPTEEQFRAAVQFVRPFGQPAIKPEPLRGAYPISVSASLFPPHVPEQGLHVPRKAPAIH